MCPVRLCTPVGKGFSQPVRMPETGVRQTGYMPGHARTRLTQTNLPVDIRQIIAYNHVDFMDHYSIVLAQ